MTENKAVFTLTAVLHSDGRLKVKTDGICPNHLLGKVIEEICYQYDEVDINIDKTLILDGEDGEFYEEVAETATDENGEETSDDYCADGEVADPANDDDADDGVDDEETSDDSDADGEVADPADDVDADDGVDDEETSDDSDADGEVADPANDDDADDGVDGEDPPNGSGADE